LQLGELHCSSSEIIRLAAFFSMYLFYLDAAGSAANANEEYLVLGGVSIYEAQAHWFT
jgi:hypothetical protein